MCKHLNDSLCIAPCGAVKILVTYSNAQAQVVIICAHLRHSIGIYNLVLSADIIVTYQAILDGARYTQSATGRKYACHLGPHLNERDISRKMDIRRAAGGQTQTVGIAVVCLAGI